MVCQEIKPPGFRCLLKAFGEQPGETWNKGNEAPRPKGRGRSTKAHGSERVEELLGKVASFILCPFLPAGRQGPRSEERGLRGTFRSRVGYQDYNLDKILIPSLKSFTSSPIPFLQGAGSYL